MQNVLHDYGLRISPEATRHPARSMTTRLEGVLVNISQRLKSIAIPGVAILALTGCAAGGGTAESTSPMSMGELAIDTPDPKGELDSASWNLPFGEPASLDPIKAFNYPENTVVANLCEPLLQLKPDFTVAPNLASSFEVVDPKTYVYEIRNDVSFWDGSPMTVDDVVWSLQRHLDPAEGSYWAGDVTENIASIEKTGEWQVTISLNKPDTTFNSYMVTPIGVVTQRAQREAAGDQYGTPSGGVMCTGPFSVGAWDQGQQIVLERNDNYWNENLKPKTKELAIKFLVDQSAIATALQTGEIDGSYDVPLGAVPSLQSSTSGSLYYGKSTQIVAVISTGRGPFGEAAVRKALMLATDREGIAQAVFEGTATASSSLVPNQGWSYGNTIFESARAELPGSTVDLEAAKKLIEDSGVDTDAPIRIAYPAERTFYADMLSEMANAATALGLKVEPVGIPSAQFGALFSDEAARAQYDGFVTYNYEDVPDPLAHMRAILATDGGSNYNNFSDPAVDSMIKEALAEPDSDKRAELAVEIQREMMDLTPWVPLVDPATRLYMNNRVTGVPASFAYLYYPWAAELGAA